MKLNKLTDEEQAVILQKQTEMPYSGEYDNFFQNGMYVCRQCNNPLYSSKAKFDAGCGWPAFDDEVKGSVQRIPILLIQELQKLTVINAEDIWATFILAKDLLRKTRDTASIPYQLNSFRRSNLVSLNFKPQFDIIWYALLR